MSNQELLDAIKTIHEVRNSTARDNPIYELLTRQLTELLEVQMSRTKATCQTS